MNTVFVDPERCIGCHQCEIACAVAHSRSRDPVAALGEDPLPRPRIHVEAGPAFNSSFPNKCRHCLPAPCQQVCPTGAIQRAPDGHLVLVETGRCIACAMCAMVCPFDAVTFHRQVDGVPARVVATKCDGCVHRVRKGLLPACVEACKTGALVYGEVNELVRAGRLRDSAVALAAAGEGPAPTVPENVIGWRSWGHTAAEVAERA
jgi:carbon-monoxide dehydrogenase iron sulfur subunit